jgi:hypothetical protein
MSVTTLTPEARSSFGGFKAEILALLELFGAARRVTAATRSGRRPADADLETLGIAPANFPRIV